MSVRKRRPKESLKSLFCRKTYVPTANDIGHILRVECRVMRQSAGLIQSKVVDTGIVLPCELMIRGVKCDC